MSLRERKRARTRQALVDAAVALFERDGYERTKVADIAAAAEIGTRTFFSYFACKEDLLFPESDLRVRAAITAIEGRAPGEGPAEVLLRALGEASAESDDLTGPLAALRLRLSREVLAVRGRALQIQYEAQREIAGRLATAYPQELDAVSAAALVGAFVGAIAAALGVLLEESPDRGDPADVRAALRRATDIALRPWLTHPTGR